LAAIALSRSAVAMLLTASSRSAAASLLSETSGTSTGALRARLVGSWRIDTSVAPGMARSDQ